MTKLKNKLLQTLEDIWNVYVGEVRRIFSDGGVVLIFVVATMLYPMFFGAIYKNELVRDLPIAVVDESQSTDSYRFIKKLNATPEINVNYDCASMEEAETLIKQRKINGIVYFPRDFTERLSRNETARIGLFCDMSSFLYYRSLYTGASAVLIDEMNSIKIERYSLLGITGESAEELVTPIPYEDVKLYSNAGGFTSFLVPALLVLVLHQTLFLGIGIMGGTMQENRTSLNVFPKHLRSRHIGRVSIGRAIAYLGIYIPLSAVVLLLIPRWFGLPHIGQLNTLILFVIPFLLATIFFSLTIGSLVRHRDSGIICSIFFSVILLFLSGAVWPQCNMPIFWRYFSYLFPSTPGIQCFIRINSMGATLSEVRFEYILLWIQIGVYFTTSCIANFITLHRHKTAMQTTINQ